MSDLNELKNKYKEYLDLNYVKSLNDSEEKPYESKYKARELLNGVKATLNQSLEDNNELTKHYYKALDPRIQKLYSKSSKTYLIDKVIEFNLAKNYIETEEYEQGERLLSKNVKELEKQLELENDSTFSIKIYSPLVYNLIINYLNELVYVWTYRGDYDKCISLLNKSKEIYDYYKEIKSQSSSSTASPFQVPFTINELIAIDTPNEDEKTLNDDKRELLFESVYTHSLFYMAQIYGKLNDKDKSALYCQLTLQRQIDYKNTNDDFVDNLNDVNKISFDPIDWATHAAALSQYYVSCGDYSTARHCLCCAEAIIDKLNQLKSADSNEEYLNKLNEQTASIRRCWGKYSIELLKSSIQYLNTGGKKEDFEFDKPSKFHFNINKNEYNLDKCERDAITPNYAFNYEDAKKMFVKGQQILNESAKHYVFDGYVTDHCEIKRDICELYKLIMSFDTNEENRSKYLKRKLDLLLPLAKELSEQYYLYVKRQLLFDIATTYSDMMDIKFELLQKKRENPKNYLKDKSIDLMVNKINQLCVSAIDYYEQFLNTMKPLPNKDKLPEKYDANNVRPALLAHFYIGRLYSKIIPYETVERLLNMKKTLNYYKYLVEYCDKNANDFGTTTHGSGNDETIDVMNLMKIEYDICKEMVAFLPANMENISKALKP